MDRIRYSLDKLGAFLSFSCAVHCLVLPLAIATLPLAGLQALEDPSVERFFLFGTLSLALVAAFWGFISHRNYRVFILFCAAFGLILTVRHFFPHGGWMEGLGMAVGGGLLATMHWVNTRLCKTCHTHCH